MGAKAEFQIDTQYVGWVKGPRGKVVQDIQVGVLKNDGLISNNYY